MVSDFQKTKSNPQKKAIVMELIKTTLWLFLIIFKRYKFLKGIGFHVLNVYVFIMKRLALFPRCMCVSAGDCLCTHNVGKEIPS